jgi:hypothetical protein
MDICSKGLTLEKGILEIWKGKKKVATIGPTFGLSLATVERWSQWAALGT